MSWAEFSTLLAGLMPKTPLGQIVSIRSEEDKNMLKHFTKEQKRIREEWRSRNNSVANLTDEEKSQAIREVQELFKKAFG